MATVVEALPKNVVVADSVGKARPSSFLLRSSSEPHLNYMFSKYDHLTNSDSYDPSPSSSRSPSPTAKDDSMFSNAEDDNSSISTTGSSTPKRPAPVLERRHTLRDPSALRLSFSSSSTSLSSLRSKKRPNSVAFMKAPAADGQMVTLASHKSTSAATLSSAPNSYVRKDELWLGFKTLESDYSKFNCKSILQRTHVLRASLIPFLRKFEGCTSQVAISIEELDKRIRTLNKWWTLLLSSLRAQGSNMVPLQDRSTYLEGVMGIINRPEWRAAPSSLAPSSARSPSPSNSCSSLASASSTMSYEKSLQHDMKVMFTTSLLDTLVFVLHGMSDSQCGWLVHFAGKVMAYAFFFVNGVSDMLVGSLGLKAPQLRKILNEYGIGRGMDLQTLAEGVIGEFPQATHSVGFTTMAAALPRLRRPSSYYVATSSIDWQGPWLSRWTGRETEMFFIFVKQYHLLLAEYLPVGISATARLCAPGFIFIQAQLLSLLETAINRGPSHLTPQENNSNVTFDDIVGAQMANGNSVQQAPQKTMYRPLFDQRIFSLLKDIMHDKAFNDAMRDVFATAFAYLLKSLARGTKVSEHAACVSLCDMMEEGIPALHQFERLSETGAKYIDWPFWVEVSKHMLKNENSMSELRLFSFLYVIWDLIAEDLERKRSVCLDWLLSDEMWDRYFSHWSSMVRAYYMRLLCWRVGRLSLQNDTTAYPDDGGELSQTSLDAQVFQALSAKLHEAQAVLNFLRDEADRNSGSRPSTVPCPPAPNRKLAIIRVETQPGFGRPFSLDRALPAPPAEVKPEIPIPVPSPKPEENGTAQGDATVGSVIKKRWSLLRSFIGATEAMKPEPAAQTPKTESPAPTVPGKSQANATYIPPRTSSGRDAWQSIKIPYGATFPAKTKTQFKFMLEYSERAPHGRKTKGVNPPRLPRATQEWLEGLQEYESVGNSEPTLPDKPSQNSKYYGRALSEWTLVIDEIDNFIERRKNEGMTDSRDAEIPILTVDSLRRG